MNISCKTSKNVVVSENFNKKLSAKQIIREHSKKEAKFKTMQSRVKLEYNEGQRSQSHQINFRIKKNEIIWISATLGVLRVKITPGKVSFYNKLDKTYFDGDFSLISDLLGTNLDFYNVQNILLGDAVFTLSDEKFHDDFHEKSYVLSPKNQKKLYEIFYLLNPKHFKMDSQQLAQPQEHRMLQIDYEGYQEVSNQLIPKTIKVIAVQGNDEMSMNLEFKSVVFNTELRFPFRIPNGFEQIIIK